MKRIALLAVLVAVTIGTSVKWSSAQSSTHSADLLGVLPDGGAVAVIDFQKLAGSTLWATISAQDKLKSAIDKAQSEMTGLGLKLSDVQTVAIVFPAANMGNPTVALSGGFDQSDLLSRVRANSKVKLTSEKYKDFDIYKARSIPGTGPKNQRPGTRPGVSVTAVITDETAFVFHDARTLVTGSLEAVRASIDVKIGAKPSITQNAKLVDALAQNPAAAIRFAISLTPAMTSGLNSSELPMPDFSSISLIFGTIDVASGIDLNATLRSDTAEHAKSVAERLNGLLAMARGFLGAVSDPKMAPIVEALKTVNIVSADVDVKVTGSLPMGLFNSLLSSSIKKGL
jgi:hypothetical protein